MNTSKETIGRRIKIAVIDDDIAMNGSICALLKRRDFDVISFPSGKAFLTDFSERLRECDLIVSDVNMPGLSGYDLCREIRGLEGEERIPIILVTGSDPEDKSQGIDAGADDFIQKPFPSRELLAKIDSLLAIRNTALNRSEKLGRLTHFLSPTVARLVTSETSQGQLQPHRREVTVLFVDLRRFTAFAERAEPEEVMEVLGRYYQAVGSSALGHQGTVGHLAGDGMMIFFNDPEQIANHQAVAVQAALAICRVLKEEKKAWEDNRYDIDFGVGIAEGEAMIGRIGFDHFWQ